MNKQVFHRDLAAGRWFGLSLAQQLGNIGSEVGRAAKAQGKDDARFWAAVIRAQELFFLTLSDGRRTKSQKKEICRAYEVFCDAVSGGRAYGSDLKYLDRYFSFFAILSMAKIFKK